MSDREKLEAKSYEVCGTCGCGYCSRHDAMEVKHSCEDRETILSALQAAMELGRDGKRERDAYGRCVPPCGCRDCGRPRELGQALIAEIGAPGPESTEDTVGREAFISVYVDLRAAALTLRPTETGLDVRDSILAAHGVTGEDLLEFVDTHGERVEFMSGIWSEVEGLLTERLEQNILDEENEEL